MKTRNLTVGVDASRNRSGGAIAHIRGLMQGSDPRDFGIKTVHLWAYKSLLDKVNDQPWLTKHEVHATRQGMAQQLWWQFRVLPRLLDETGCDVVFNTDAGSVCPTRRAVTLSQDMLSFETGEMRRYGFSKARMRLEILKFVQSRSLKRSRCAIYLTRYARDTIEAQIGRTNRSVVIPHGIDDKFRSEMVKRRPWPTESIVQCLYVSNAAPYKHQWHVIKAISTLRSKGYSVHLTLVGGGNGPAMARIEEAIAQHDPNGEFVFQKPFIPNDRIPKVLENSHLFIFASSCENLPITLLEAMASGIPICSSNRGPMPEVLGDNGCYFDPEAPSSISEAVQSLIDDASLRESCSADSLKRSKSYTWSRCSSETWRTLASVCMHADN